MCRNDQMTERPTESDMARPAQRMHHRWLRSGTRYKAGGFGADRHVCKQPNGPLPADADLEVATRILDRLRLVAKKVDQHLRSLKQAQGKSDQSTRDIDLGRRIDALEIRADECDALLDQIGKAVQARRHTATADVTAQPPDDA